MKMKGTVVALLTSLLLFAGASKTSADTTKANPKSPSATVSTNEEVNCRHGQCLAIAKSTGERCKHCVSNPGDLYCYQHK